jgi:hypothetical protein
VRDLKGHAMTQSPIVAAFWDAPTGSWQYVFHDPATMKGAIVDPVWNFDRMRRLRPIDLVSSVNL